MTVKNAFQAVKPRGADTAPAKAPRKTTNTSSNSAFGSIKTLDARGRHTVPFVSPPHFGLLNAQRTADAGVSQ